MQPLALHQMGDGAFLLRPWTVGGYEPLQNSPDMLTVAQDSLTVEDDRLQRDGDGGPPPLGDKTGMSGLFCKDQYVPTTPSTARIGFTDLNAAGSAIRALTWVGTMSWSPNLLPA